MASKPAPKKAPPAKTPKAKKPAARKSAAGIGALVAIYALSDPETGEIRYIGKANDPRARLKSHIRDSRRRNTPVCCWIKKLAQHGATPTMSILEWTDDWIEAERRLIAKYRAENTNLLNIADGGDQPACTREQRIRNATRQAATQNKPLWALKRAIGIARRSFEDKGDFERFATMDYLALRLGQVSIETQMRVAKAWGFCPEGQTS